MKELESESETHLVFVPAPGMGHFVSTVEFAKLLINRDHRVSITILVIKTPYDAVTSSYTLSLSSTQRLHIIILPHSHSNPDPNDPSSSMIALIDSNKHYVRDHVTELVRDSTRLGAFVVDMFCTTMIDVAREFDVPAYVFFTSGVAFLGLMLHLHTLRERDNVNVTELKDSDTEFVIPSFSNSVPAKVFPSVVLSKEWDPFFLTYAELLKKADGILVNSFDELEPHAIQSFSDDNNNIPFPLYPVGPILNIKDKEGDDVTDMIMTWLDEQPPSSVIFLCFGSMGSFDVNQVLEIAHALEVSGSRFIWSLRKPPPMGLNIIAPPSAYTAQELVEVLPEGFLDRTAEIGRVIGWAPQAQILAHKATAGFVSHCGWNSTLESIYFGVPIATWPLYAEQQTNAFELVKELKLGVEIALDYRVEFKVGSSTVLSAEKIERGIRDLVENDEIRKKVKEMSEKSRETLSKGGSSYSHLGRFIDSIIN